MSKKKKKDKLRHIDDEVAKVRKGTDDAQGRPKFRTGSTTQGGSDFGQGSIALGNESFRQGSEKNSGSNYENENW